MKIEIEVYKDQTIYYDDEADKFVCEISIEDRAKRSKRGSLKDLRKEIDLFIKENLDFKPFKAIRKSSYGGCEFYVVEVKAIRTDRKLIVGLEGSSRNDHVGKSEAVHFMRYDHDLVKELKEIEDEYDNARKVRDMKRVELNKRLVPLDLSKYDLV